MKTDIKPKKRIMKSKYTNYEPEWQKATKTGKAGLNIAHIGEQTSGKSIAALQYGYLDLKYENELVSAGYEDVVQALKDGLIPEVKKIYRVESELDSGQLNRPIERALIGEIWDNKVEHIRVEPVSDDIMLKVEGTERTEEGLDLINKSFNQYMGAFEQIAKKQDPESAMIVDSMTLFKYLIDLQCSITWQKQAREGDEEWNKGVNSNKWVLRNQYNRKALLYLRSIPGWTILTFREVKNSDWVIQTYGSEPTKFDWTNDTGFQMDMVYHFKKNKLNNDLTVKSLPEYCRYLYRGKDSDKYNEFKIDKGSRISIFPAIQGVIKTMREEEGKIHW